jgi:hypothetical protein
MKSTKKRWPVWTPAPPAPTDSCAAPRPPQLTAAPRPAPLIRATGADARQVQLEVVVDQLVDWATRRARRQRVLQAWRAMALFERRSAALLDVQLRRRNARAVASAFVHWRTKGAEMRTNAQIVRRVVGRMGGLLQARALERWRGAVRLRALLLRAATRWQGRTAGAAFAKWSAVWVGSRAADERRRQAEALSQSMGEKEAALLACQAELQELQAQHKEERQRHATELAAREAEHTAAMERQHRAHAEEAEAAATGAEERLRAAVARQDAEHAEALAGEQQRAQEAAEAASVRHGQASAALRLQHQRDTDEAARVHAAAVAALEAQLADAHARAAAIESERLATEQEFAAARAAAQAAATRALGLLDGWAERWRTTMLRGAAWKRWCVGVWMARREAVTARLVAVEQQRAELNEELHHNRAHFRAATLMAAEETALLLQASGSPEETADGVALRWEELAELALGCPGTIQQRDTFECWRAGCAHARWARRRQRAGLTFGGVLFDEQVVGLFSLPCLLSRASPCLIVHWLQDSDGSVAISVSDSDEEHETQMKGAAAAGLVPAQLPEVPAEVAAGSTVDSVREAR